MTYDLRCPKCLWIENKYRCGRRVQRIGVSGMVVDNNGEVVGYIEDYYFDGENYIIDATECWPTKREALAATTPRKGGRRCRTSGEKLLKEVYGDVILRQLIEQSAITPTIIGATP